MPFSNADRRSLQSVAEFKKGMEALGTEVSTKIGVRANIRAARHLEKKLVAAAPVSHRASTTKSRKAKDGTVTKFDFGHLRDNIRVKRQKAVKQHHIIHLVTVGRAFWGTFLEWGTRFLAPHPWMRPTVESSRDELETIQMTELANGIERAAKKKFGRTLPNGRNG